MSALRHRKRGKVCGVPVVVEEDITQTLVEPGQTIARPAYDRASVFTPSPEMGLGHFILKASKQTHTDAVMEVGKRLGFYDAEGNIVPSKRGLGDKFVFEHHIPLIIRGSQTLEEGEVVRDDIKYFIRVDFPVTPWRQALQVLESIGIPPQKISIVGLKHEAVRKELRECGELYLLESVARNTKERQDYIRDSLVRTQAGTRVYYSPTTGIKFLTVGSIGDTYEAFTRGELSREQVLQRMVEIRSLINQDNVTGSGREMALFMVGPGYRPELLDRTIETLRQDGKAPHDYIQSLHEYHLNVQTHTPEEFQTDDLSSPVWVKTMYESLWGLPLQKTPIEMHTTWLPPNDPKAKEMRRLLHPVFPGRKILDVGQRTQPVTKRLLTGGEREVWLVNVEGLPHVQFLREMKWSDPAWVSKVFRIVDGVCVGVDRVDDMKKWEAGERISRATAQRITRDYARWTVNRIRGLSELYSVLSDPRIMMPSQLLSRFLRRDFREDLLPLDSLPEEMYCDTRFPRELAVATAPVMAVNMAAGSEVVGTGDELVGFKPVRLLQTDPTTCFRSSGISRPLDSDPHCLLLAVFLAKTLMLSRIWTVHDNELDKIRGAYLEGISQSLKRLGEYTQKHPHWNNAFEVESAPVTGRRWDMGRSWRSVIDRLTPGKENYREPATIVDKIDSMVQLINETALGVLKTEVSIQEKVAVMRPLMTAFTVDPELPLEIVRIISSNDFLSQTERTKDKVRLLELLAIRMAVEKAARPGHFKPTEIDDYARLCLERFKRASTAEERVEKARSMFAQTEPPLRFGELYLPLRYKEVLFDAMLERNGEFRREMGEKGFLWPAKT